MTEHFNWFLTALADGGEPTFIFESAALSLVIVLGYLGFDRIGGGISSSERVSDEIQKQFELQIKSAIEFFKERPNFSVETVHNKHHAALCIILRYIVQYHDGDIDKEKYEENIVSLKPKRMTLGQPLPLSTYWIFWESYYDNNDKFPLYLVLFLFMKFFAMGFWEFFSEVGLIILFLSFILDFAAILWVMQRTSRISRIKKYTLHIFDSWQQYQKAVLESEFKVPSTSGLPRAEENGA